MKFFKYIWCKLFSHTARLGDVENIKEIDWKHYAIKVKCVRCGSRYEIVYEIRDARI